MNDVIAGAVKALKQRRGELDEAIRSLEGVNGSLRRTTKTTKTRTGRIAGRPPASNANI